MAHDDRFSGLLRAAAGAAFGLLLLPAAAHAQPVEGVWEGPTFQLFPFVLDVPAGAATVANIRFHIQSNNTKDFNLPGPYTLTAGAFDTGVTGGTCPSVHVTGTFTSPTTLSGTILINYMFDPQTCPNPGTGGIDFSATPGLRGDANGDGQINVTDVLYLINNLFAGGQAPPDTKHGDADHNNSVTVSDVLYLISFLFAGGHPPT